MGFGGGVILLFCSCAWSVTVNACFVSELWCFSSRERRLKTWSPPLPCCHPDNCTPLTQALTAVDEWCAPWPACPCVQCAATTRVPPSLNICHPQMRLELVTLGTPDGFREGLVMFCFPVVGSGWTLGKGSVSRCITGLYQSGVRCCWSADPKSHSALDKLNIEPFGVWDDTTSRRAPPHPPPPPLPSSNLVGWLHFKHEPFG